MGFFSALTGSDSGSTTEQTTKSNQTQTQKGTTKQSGQSTTTALDSSSLALLQSVVANLGTKLGTDNPDAILVRSLIPQLLQSASPEAIDAGIAASSQAAIQAYKKGEGANIANVQQQVGSKGNSFSALLEQQGNVDLASTLASIAENARAQGRQQFGQNVATAIGAGGTAAQINAQQTNDFLGGIKALEGAQVTQNTSETQIQDMLATLVADSFSKQHTSASTANGFFPTITNLLGAFKPAG
jgi:hypothetical protein